MRVTILALGSRGDVQPFIRFALELERAGHTPTIGADPRYEAWIRSFGVAFAPVRYDLEEALKSRHGQALLRSGRNTLSFVYNVLRMSSTLLGTSMDDSWKASQGADVLVMTPLAMAGAGYAIAELLGIPAVMVQLAPSVPTKAFPSVCAPPLPLGGAYNLLTHRFFNTLGAKISRSSVEQVEAWRKKLDASSSGRRGLVFEAQRSDGPAAEGGRPPPPLHIMCGFSEAVVPRPVDWPDSVSIEGFWFLDESPGFTPSAELAEFLAAGPPPVFVSFGTAGWIDEHEQLLSLVRGAARDAKVRTIIAVSRGVMEDHHTRAAVQSDCLLLDGPVPHSWLFPKVAGVVHHAGAGTTAAAMRAGVPHLAVPFYGDTFFWGHRMSILGVGPRSIPRTRLTRRRLARALADLVRNPSYRMNARELGERIRAEDGARQAVKSLEQFVARATGVTPVASTEAAEMSPPVSSCRPRRPLELDGA